MSREGRILIVDDEPSIRLFLGAELAQAGYQVLAVASGEEALALLQEEPVDLILLDLKMDGVDGLQVMAELEKQPLPPVVIMLTAHASFDAAIVAMRRGGHDYLIKPCRIEELLASVEKGLARRREALQRQKLACLIEDSARQLRGASPPEEKAPPAQSLLLKARDLILDRERHTVTRGGQPVRLTPTEFRLLSRLVAWAGQVVSFRELVQELYEGEGEMEWDRQAIRTHLWRLRRKLGNGPDGVPYIVSVSGQGYRFIP
jgi:DNA-binding response OmpR family regulator